MDRCQLLDLHLEMCDDARELMARKNQDYSADTDPFYNLRRYGEVGILVRMCDKFARLESFMAKGFNGVEDETVRDTLLDLINYSVLFMAFLKNSEKPKNGKENKLDD